jgi:hypothetical protein
MRTMLNFEIILRNFNVVGNRGPAKDIIHKNESLNCITVKYNSYPSCQIL